MLTTRVWEIGHGVEAPSTATAWAEDMIEKHFFKSSSFFELRLREL